MPEPWSSGPMGASTSPMSLPGGTAREIVQSAQCPAVVIRHPDPKRRAEHKKPPVS